VLGEGRAKESPVLGQHQAVLVSQLLEEAGRASTSVKRKVTVPLGSSTIQMQLTTVGDDAYGRCVWHPTGSASLRAADGWPTAKLLPAIASVKHHPAALTVASRENVWDPGTVGNPRGEGELTVRTLGEACEGDRSFPNPCASPGQSRFSAATGVGLLGGLGGPSMGRLG
jgi:hypothetical protein